MKFWIAVLFLIEFSVGGFAGKSDLLKTNPRRRNEDVKCGAIPVQQWSEHRSRRVEYLARPLDLVIIQHTATPECNTDAGCQEIARNIQTYHVETLKWDDIGQSFLIGGNGKVYEGAGWLHVGAHTYGYNRRSIGVSFIGNFNEKLPSTKALEAAKALLNCGVTKGHLDNHYKLVGHKQVLATESPGAKLYAEIQNWPHYLNDVSGINEQ